MSTRILKFDNEKKKKKRDYSKNGCRECKRRKIKCDEVKPACWQCRRLKKSCSYPGVGEKVLRVSRKLMDNYDSYREPEGSMPFNTYGHRTTVDTHINPNIRNNQQQTAAYIQPQSNIRELYPPRLVPPSIINLLNDTHQRIDRNGINGTSSTTEIPEKESRSLSSTISNDPNSFQNLSEERSGSAYATPSTGHPIDNNNMLLLNSDGFYDNPEDLNLLATDLNDIVNSFMFEANFDTKMYENDFQSVDTFFDELISKDKEPDGELNMNANTNEEFDESIPRHIPIDFIKVKTKREEKYLKGFYDIFAEIILPFNSYDDKVKAFFNPLRDILLRCASEEPFLLAGILALGAKACFEKTNLPEDEEAFFKYLSKCLKMLEPSLKNRDDKDKKSWASNIDSVLITVLLLTGINALSSKQEWRPHLRGAKDILLRYSSNSLKYPRLRNSKLMIFCKFMFASYETLAGLSSKFGGTLKESEIDLLICAGDPHEVKALRDLGIVRDDGFNLLCGYHNSCIPHLRDLIKILNKTRSKGNKFKPNDTFEYIRLISEFHAQTNIEFVTKKYFLQPLDFKDGIIPDNLLLETVMINNVQHVISWMDICHQIYALASLIIIITHCFQLTYKSAQVQSLICKLMEPMIFLESYLEGLSSKKVCVMMLQWPMYIAGINCISEEHKQLIMKCFNISTEAGSRSADLTLKKIKKIWDLHTNNKEWNVDDDDIDIVTY